MNRLLRTALLMLYVASPALAAEQLSGRARIIDGDTLSIGGVNVRLQGIAAPELAHGGEPGQGGGEEVASFMCKLVQGRTVIYELTGERTHGREVRVCRVEGRDVGAVVIKAGLARDCPRYSGGRYAGLEPPGARWLPFPTYCEPR